MHFQPRKGFSIAPRSRMDEDSLMRLAETTSLVIKKHVSEFVPESDCYLFGSRVNDKLKGGDIDLLLLTPEKLSLSRIRALRRRILSQVGEQKLDIVNFTRESNHPFKTAALEHAVRL